MPGITISIPLGPFTKSEDISKDTALTLYQAPAEAAHAMSKILCIEDDADIREDIVEELQEAHYEVLEAGSGSVGLEMILRHKPDLVLCDINMPSKNGYELLQEIREKYVLFAEMPFIFLSALGGREDVLVGLQKGADAYLVKPIDFELLLVTIHASLRQMERVKQMREKLYELGAYQSSLRTWERMKKEREPNIELDI